MVPKPVQTLGHDDREKKMASDNLVGKTLYYSILLFANEPTFFTTILWSKSGPDRAKKGPKNISL